MTQTEARPEVKAAHGLDDQPLAAKLHVLYSWPFSRHVTPEKCCCRVSLQDGNVTRDIPKSRTSF